MEGIKDVSSSDTLERVDAFLRLCGDPGHGNPNSIWDVSALVSGCRMKKVGGKLFTTVTAPASPRQRLCKL